MGREGESGRQDEWKTGEEKERGNRRMMKE